MDLKDLTPTSDTVEVEIRHPSTGKVLKNEDESNMTICMYLPHSKEHKAALHKQTNSKLKRVQKSGKVDITAEELDESTYELMADITHSWNITYEGTQPKLTKNTAMKVYKDVFWIKTQLEEGLEDAMDFGSA